MLRWALIFLAISLVSAVFGFTGIAAGAATLARVFFFVSLVVFLGFLIAGVALERKLATKL